MWLLKWKAEQVITSLLFLWRKAMERFFGGQCWQHSDIIRNGFRLSKEEIRMDFITCVVTPDSDISCETYSGENAFLHFTHIMYLLGTPYLFTLRRRLVGGQNDCFMYSEVSRCVWSFVTEDCVTCMVTLQHCWRCYNNAPGPRRHYISLQAHFIYSSDLCSWELLGCFHEKPHPKILPDWLFAVLFCRNISSY